MLQVQDNEDVAQDNDASDSESDHEEELEGSDDDYLDEARESASDCADSEDAMTAALPRSSLNTVL